MGINLNSPNTDPLGRQGDNRTLGEQCHDALVRTGEVKAEAFELERLFKLKRRFVYLGTKGTVAERDALAATQDEVQEAERLWVDAEKKLILARAEADGLDKVFEEWRTRESTARAEMQMR